MRIKNRKGIAKDLRQLRKVLLEATVHTGEWCLWRVGRTKIRREEDEEE